MCIFSGAAALDGAPMTLPSQTRMNIFASSSWEPGCETSQRVTIIGIYFLQTKKEVIKARAQCVAQTTDRKQFSTTLNNNLQLLVILLACVHTQNANSARIKKKKNKLSHRMIWLTSIQHQRRDLFPKEGNDLLSHKLSQLLTN